MDAAVETPLSPRPLSLPRQTLPQQTLHRQTLHCGVADPMVGTIGFLNEVMSRHPEAISFAPGAVHERFFQDVDLPRYLARYTQHLARRGVEGADALSVLYQYGPSQGLIGDLVADALRRDEGIDVPPDGVVITVGCQEALFVALRTLCRSAADVVAVIDPCYPGVVGAARMLDLTLVPVPAGEPGGVLDQVRAVCVQSHQQGKRVRVLYVAPDFANPSGEQLSLPDRRALLAAATREDFLIIEDSAYAFTADRDRALPSLKALDQQGRVIYVGSFAKVGLPGARVGYAAAEQPVPDANGRTRTLASELAAVKSVVTVNTSPITQAVVGGMLLEHGGSLAHLARRKAALYRANLGRLLRCLDQELGAPSRRVPGVSWNRPCGGFFVRVQLPVPVTEALLERSARDHGVLWTPMSTFHLGGGGRFELRLSCSYLTFPQIAEGVARLARWIRAETADTDRPGPGPGMGGEAEPCV